MTRLSYADSIAALKRRAFLAADENPKPTDKTPSPLDDLGGLAFFRTLVEGDLSGLTLPRTLFCRSEITACNFAGSDFGESFFCWNDFTDVDFSGALLRGADLRRSTFTRVHFTSADLSGADLRGVGFEACDFAGTILYGAKASRSSTFGLKITPEQNKQINWSLTSGDEPPGG